MIQSMDHCITPSLRNRQQEGQKEEKGVEGGGHICIYKLNIYIYINRNTHIHTRTHSTRTRTAFGCQISSSINRDEVVVAVVTVVEASLTPVSQYILIIIILIDNLAKSRGRKQLQ